MGSSRPYLDVIAALGDRLGRVIERTPAAVIDPQAQAQRSGVLASFNWSQMPRARPPEARGDPTRSATIWATKQGRLFLTTSLKTRDALVQLPSLWLDTHLVDVLVPLIAAMVVFQTAQRCQVVADTVR
jgi:hypothetical protein